MQDSPPENFPSAATERPDVYPNPDVTVGPTQAVWHRDCRGHEATHDSKDGRPLVEDVGRLPLTWSTLSVEGVIDDLSMGEIGLWD